MNDAQIKALVLKGNAGMTRIENGLYLRISDAGTGFWVFRYSFNKKRRQIILGTYGRAPEHIPLREVRDLVASKRADVRNGIDPLIEKSRAKIATATTLDSVATDWLGECKKRLQHPEIPARVYKKDISPALGDLPIKQITSGDILSVVRTINKSGRPSIANDALIYFKQLFNHAIKLGATQANPALALNAMDAGGVEKSRTRSLTFEELSITFSVLKSNDHIFTRENYLAVALLLCLGVRKTELIAARWEEFDLDNLIWTLPAQRTKTNSEIRIPIPDCLTPWFTELKYRANSSEYLFPNRRHSRRRAYISDDTLNHALAKMFGKKVDSNKNPYPNLLGNAGIEHFVVHDLRRTCRSILSELGVPSHVAERCLNHKIRGVEGVYDRYDYFEERKVAFELLAKRLIIAIN